MEKHRISAIYDDDLDSFLGSLGLLTIVKSGKAKCAICKDRVGFDNLHAVFPHDNKIDLCCDTTSCTVALKELLTHARHP